METVEPVQPNAMQQRMQLGNPLPLDHLRQQTTDSTGSQLNLTTVFTQPVQK